MTVFVLVVQPLHLHRDTCAARACKSASMVSANMVSVLPTPALPLPAGRGAALASISISIVISAHVVAIVSNLSFSGRPRSGAGTRRST